MDLLCCAFHIKAHFSLFTVISHYLNFITFSEALLSVAVL